MLLAQQKVCPQASFLAHSWGDLPFFPLLYENLSLMPATVVFLCLQKVVKVRKLPLPSPGKYFADFCNRRELSSLLHKRQTDNPCTIYHKSLDPVFEFGSLISCKYIQKPVRSFDHVNLPRCSISLKSLSEKLRNSVRDTGEGFSLSEENYF